MTYRVVQWATGAIGKTCLRAVLDRPDMSLAGVYVYAARKAGQDAGAIARYPDTGITATRSIEEIRTTGWWPPPATWPSARA